MRRILFHTHTHIFPNASHTFSLFHTHTHIFPNASHTFSYAYAYFSECVAYFFIRIRIFFRMRRILFHTHTHIFPNASILMTSVMLIFYLCLIFLLISSGKQYHSKFVITSLVTGYLYILRIDSIRNIRLRDAFCRLNRNILMMRLLYVHQTSQYCIHGQDSDQSSPSAHGT